MNVYTHLENLPSFKNAVITVGTFDGVHKGHQMLINTINKAAETIGGESVLITFHPHPRSVIFPEQELKLISTLEEKKSILESFGLQNLVIIPFSRAFSEMEPEQYIQDFLIHYFNPKIMVLGYDHHFGKNRTGNIDTLKKHQEKFSYELIEIERQDIDAWTVSSTKIRNALKEGNITLVNSLLGHSFSFSGNVVKGNQLGRTIGFPTANIALEDNTKILFKYGVYAVKIQHKKDSYQGVLNYGKRPTVNGLHETIEVFIFDFNEDIYGEKLTIEVIEYIRDEQKFNGIDALKQQIALDVEAAKDLLK